MKRSIRFFVLFMVLFIGLSTLYAGGIVESGSSIDGRLYFLSKNTINNKNKAMNLNVTSVYNTGTTGIQQAWDSASPAQALFRLMDTLYTEGNSTDLYLKISSNNDWKFIHEENPSYTRDFDINAFRYQGSFDATWFGWSHAFGDYVESEVTSSVPKSSGYYLFPIPTGARQNENGKYLVPKTITDIDVCIALPAYGGTLIDGYYYTDLQYEVTDSAGNLVTYQEHSTKIGTRTNTFTADQTPTMSGSFRVWGYVGENHNDNSKQYVFNILESDYTFNVDLKKDSYFDVAHIQFMLDVIENTDTDPSDANDPNRYTVYISPGDQYDSTSYTANDYNFKKLDTERLTPRQDSNTVYYELYKTKTGTPFDPYEGHPYVYKLVADYHAEKIADYSQGSIGGGSSINKEMYRQSWRIEDQPVYLKVTNDSLGKEHLKGLYTTYLYFTLVEI